MSIVDVLRARRTLAGHLPSTPIWSYPALDEVAGATVYVKHENVQPTGAFKVRGGINLLAGMSVPQRRRGLVTYSTGNHAQSIAYAGRLFDTRTVIMMPETANEAKVNAVRALGAEVVPVGGRMSECQVAAEKLAAAEGLRLISPGDEPALLAGVGTAYLELFSAVPRLDAVVVPVGSGTGAAAACVVAAALAPDCQIIGVQSSAAPAAHDSWRAGRCVTRPNTTTVDGLATGRGFELPQRLLRDRLADFLLVDDEKIGYAQAVCASHAHTLAEGAGAAGLAAVLAYPDRFASGRVAVVCTGGNAGPAEIAALGRRATPLPVENGRP